MVVAVNWFIEGRAFPVRVDGGACEREALLLLLMAADGLKRRQSYKRLAMSALGLLVLE